MSTPARTTRPRPAIPSNRSTCFYDQLQPYGVWVDEPDFGRVFIPQEDNFVPFTVGHWEYTRLGFVWVSTEPHAWATSHYGRWAYSGPYSRWVWTPDVEWGPAWVDWRQTNDDFGWAPLAPARVSASYSPPIESWHYCGANHILDVHVTNYYEPRDRVVVIHRDARPMQHYSTVSNVRIVVGPPPSVLREHRIEVKPVRVEQRTIGRWSPTEAHAQVARAQEHKATFEVENQKRVEANTHIRAAQTKVIDTHPQLKVQVDARMEAAKRPQPATPNRVDPARPNEPARPAEPVRVAPSHPNPPTHVETKPAEPARPAPQHVAPNRPAEPARPAPQHVAPNHPAEPARPAPQHVEPNHPAEPARPAPQPQQHVEPPHPAPQPAQPHPEPPHQAPVQHTEPAKPAPAQHAEPPHPEHKEEPKK